MSKVILGNVPRRTAPTSVVKSPTATANPGAIIAGSRTYSHNGSSTTHDWYIPVDTQSGDVIWAAIQVFGGSQSITDKPAGYTTLVDETVTNVDPCQDYVFYKIASGTESDSTFTIASGDKVSAVFWRTKANGVTFNAPEVGTVTDDVAGSSGDGVNPNPITPSEAGDYAVYTVTHANKGVYTAPSTNYSEVGYVVSENVARRPRTFVQQRSVTIATSEDPGDIDWDDTAGFRQYRTWTIALRLDVGSPAVAAGDHTHVEADVTDLDHWTEADHDALDHTGLTGVGTDADAIHDNVSGEIAAVTEKVSPVSADLLLIEDSAASNAKKRVQIGNLPGGGSTALDDLTDVTITTPSTNEVLKYNGSAWVNDTDATGSGLPTGTTKGDLAVYDGSSWVRIGAGANDTVLTADSGETKGIKWASGGGTSDAELAAGPLPSYDAGESILWSGTDAASMTAVTVTGAQTITEGSGQVSVVVTSDMTANDANCLLASKTISIGDEWMVRVNSLALGDLSSAESWQYGLVFTDGTTSSSNVVFAHLQESGSGGGLLVGRHGTLTNVSTAPWVSNGSTRAFHSPVWIKVIYQASNTFRIQFSPDAVTWHALGESDISKTMTPTHVGIGWSWFRASTYPQTYNYSALLKAA